MKVETTRAYLQQHKGSILRLPKTAMLYCSILLLSIVSVQAQPPRPHKPVQVDLKKDKLEYQGFTIRLVPSLDGYFGYQILKGRQVLKLQDQSSTPHEYLEKREDAFKAAKWMVDQYVATGHMPANLPPAMPRQPVPASSINSVKP